MSGITTFLSKLGAVLAKGLAIATGVEPLILPFLGSNAKVQSTVTTVTNDLNAIASVVTQTEAILGGGGNGAQKLAAATPLVANIIKTSELVSGKKIANESLFTEACQTITNGVAQLLNSLDAGAVQTGPGPAVTVTVPATPPATPPVSS